MSETTTQNQMLQFMYGELSLDKSAALVGKIRESAVLEMEFESLIETKSQIDNCLLSPSNETIQNILNYSARRRGLETI